MRRRAPRGFTLIEIIVAVAVSAAGFAAVFALQISNMQGNLANRDQAAGAALADLSLERLRTDAYMWTDPAAPPAPLLNVAPRTWHTLTPAPVDQNGLVLGTGGVPGSALSRQRFCVHYWIDPLTDTFAGVMNARVRVIWPRDVRSVDGLAEVCREVEADAFLGRPVGERVQQFSTVTLPGTVRAHAD
jgi:prepilin-type N-terminal cleavage/methylation domain-containing protein